MSAATQVVNPQSRADHKVNHEARGAMNVLLWITQVLWGVFFSFTGFGKLLCFRQDVWNHTLHQPVPWFSAVPQGLFVFIGLSEFLGGVGLIVPALTRVKPKLTPLAAVGLTMVMLAAAVFHIVRGEYRLFLPLNLVLVGGAAFIAHGRGLVTPIAAKSLNTLRLAAGLAVLALLVLAGFLPIWYQLTHPR